MNMKMKVQIMAALLMALPLLWSEASSVWAQQLPYTPFKVQVGNIDYVEKAEKKETVGNVLAGIATTIATGKNTTQHDNYAPSVRAGIVKALGNVARFRVVDGATASDEGISADADLYVDGTIASIASISMVNTQAVLKGKQSGQFYKGLVSVTLNLKDARTGEVLDSHIFNVTDSDMSWITSAEKALNEAIERLSSRLSKYYNKRYPLRGNVVERGEDKNGKQREIYIDLGEAVQLSEGQQFDVYVLKTIAGKEAHREVGRLKVDEVMGEDLSLCKVTRGKKEVKEALDKGEKMIVISH